MSEWQDLGERVLKLAQRLVQTPSVVDTPGEAEVARVLLKYLQEQAAELPHVEVSCVAVDKPDDCRAVLGYAPAAAATRRTLLLLGHIDTVGLEPYGALEGIAYDSAALKAYYAEHGEGPLAEDAASADWEFGRGWLDMKGGVAAIVEVFLHETRRRELPANLVLLLTTDEESASRGLRALVPQLIQLKARHGLDFEHVINADYTAPLADGDNGRYFYSSVVGKLLLGISVFGKSTHVGETFGGVNASTLAGYLAYGLEHNRKLLAGVGGEWLPPPTALHVGDGRGRYDVMTCDYGEAYVNIFHLAPEPQVWWRGMLNEVRCLVRLYDRELRRRYGRFVARANQKPPRYALKPEVIDYAELRKRVVKHTGETGSAKELIGHEQALPTDDRELALFITRGLHQLLPPGRPIVVVSLLPPFYPAQVNSQHDPGTVLLTELCREAGLKHRRVYPYISDLSYFSFTENTGLEAWGAQSPLWFSPDEVSGYQALATRACNIGPWGVGAHTAEERVHVPYLRDTLPKLLSDALHALANR